MWHRIAALVIKYRIGLLILLLALTGVMGYFASNLQISYKFGNAIPTDNPKAVAYRHFREKFGEDGNMMVIGIQTDTFFAENFFKDYAKLARDIDAIPAVENVLSIPDAIMLTKDTSDGKLKARKLSEVTGLENIDSLKKEFYNLPFYKGFLYNPETNAYLMGISINKEVLNSKNRAGVIEEITDLSKAFEEKYDVKFKYSGLPLIRTIVSGSVKSEMELFLFISFALTAVILIIFFRSFTAVLSSMIIVAIGVVWSMGTTHMLGYKVTILTALIPPLIVVIGIPNCVYFLNKYHAEYKKSQNKNKALLRMLDRMGIVTLFTNLTTAIGFGVFYFTKSTLLKEFGLVASINIIAIFIISLVFIPAFYSFLPPPNSRHTNYLKNKWINNLLTLITDWVFGHRNIIYITSAVICVFSVIGMTRLKTEGFIVDDLPKEEKVYQDLVFFEKNFNGVMPLEIVIDTRKKGGATSLGLMQKMDQFSTYLEKYPEIGRRLSIVEGVKFARQAYYNGDSSSFAVPNMFDASFIQPYLRAPQGDKNSMFSKLSNSFVDSSRQIARISINMADVGTEVLPVLLDSIRPKAYEIFDTSRYDVTFTGTSVVFLEGSKYIIHSLRNSLILAFIMIFGCMIFLFRSWRIVLISVIIDLIPLLITAGIMGWMGITIKPSTVLVFSVALGITIDVTIRFLINFKQELGKNDKDISATVHKTIHDTGLSIIYTSLILIAGFGVFMLSSFDGTKALGFLTSLTLFVAMVTNLILQPAFLLWMDKVLKKSPDWLIENDEDEDEEEETEK